MQQPQQYLGVTPPISVTPPKPETEAITKTLLEELARRNQFESAEQARLRQSILGILTHLLKEFVQRACKKRNVPASAAAEAGGKIFTFGSYRLGVHGPNSDIDTLCVVPRMVEREDFFEIFLAMLQETDSVTELTSVSEAYVPVIKLKFSGISIDLTFARIALAAVGNNLDLLDDNVLRNLDPVCVRSLNGSRVTDEILRLVPNVNAFREALRTIKLWAQERAIYSNVMGFPGGVAWAMLVARICQLYPREIAGGIVSRFFLIMLKWNWPQPVVLKPIEEGTLQQRVWNPKLYPGDRAHRMPIITPAYPSMCATHNVTYSTQEILTAEFLRGSQIVDKIAVGQAQWKDLFQPHDFFSRYRYYLQVCASSGSEETHLKWSGTVESKIRQLVMKLENAEGIVYAHPFVKSFDHVYYCLTNEESKLVSSGDVPPQVAKRTKEDVKDLDDTITVYTACFYVGLKLQDNMRAASGLKRVDISYPTSEFVKMVQMWPHHNAETMGITIRYIKGISLPDFVFNGERRPAPKAQKRSKTNRTNGEAANGTPDPTSADPPAKKIRSSPQEVPATMHSTSANFVEELPTPIPLNSATASLQSATSSSAPSPLPPSLNGLLPTPMQNGRPMTPDGVPSLAELNTKTDLTAVPAAIPS